MVAHDTNLLRRFRVECLRKAEKSIALFTNKNKKVHTELITQAVDDLKSRDHHAILRSSYKLYSAAETFGRHDISNLADLLNRMMRNEALCSSDEVLKVFEDALIIFSTFEHPWPDREKHILDNIYVVLRKHNEHP